MAISKFRVLAPVAFGAGSVLALSKEQASAREHALVQHDKAKLVFEVKVPVQFKAGEVIGYDGDLPKGQAEHLEAEGKPAAKGNGKKAAVPLGCKDLPEVIDLGEGKSISGADLIKQAFEASGLDVAAWNALPDADREEKLKVLSAELAKVEG